MFSSQHLIVKSKNVENKDNMHNDTQRLNAYYFKRRLMLLLYHRMQ